MKYYSEVLDKMYDSIRELQMDEYKSKYEETIKHKDAINELIKNASDNVALAVEEYNLELKECEKLQEELDAEITKRLKPANNKVKLALQELYKLKAEYTRLQYGGF